VRDDERDLFPGFSAHLVGLSAGQHTTFTLDIPGDFDAPEVRGRTIWVDAHVAQVRSRVLPDWSDELIAKIGRGEFETIDALRENTRQQLEQAERNLADQATLEGALGQLVEGATFHYPEALVEDYLSELLVEFDRSLRQQGLTLDDFKKITGQAEEEIRELYRPRAIERAERALALGQLIDEEALDVSDEDVEAEVDAMSEALGGDQAGRFRQFLMSDQSRANISSRLATNRATGRLLAIARGENPPKGPAPEAADEATPANVAAIEAPQDAPVTKGQMEGASGAQPDTNTDTEAIAADTRDEDPVADAATGQPPSDESDDTASADE